MEHRPDPAELLRQIQQDAPVKAQGKLKIFFGYAAGVGKTYAMLEAAQDAKKRGVDVVVGYVEPHTRPETLALIDGLEVLPPLEVAYKGIALKEFDLDAALKRNPCLLYTSYLEECISSLKGQTTEANILIATSTPNAYLKNMAEKFDIPLYVSGRESGIGRDWNFALSCACLLYTSRCV